MDRREEEGMKKALILLGESKYDVLRNAAKLVSKGFEDAGYKVYIVDVTAMVQDQSLEEFDYDEYDIIFSCQAVLADWQCKDGNIFLKNYRGKYIGWIFDDFMYHIDRFVHMRYDNTYLFTIDEQFPGYINDIYPEIKNCMFLPHGGFEQKDNNTDINKNKDIDILLSGNLETEPRIEDYVYNPMPIEIEIIKKSLHYLEKNITHSMRQAIEKVLFDLGEKCDGELWKELHSCMRYIDKYIRYLWKKRITDCLVCSGLNVHIVGDGFLQEDYMGFDNVKIYGGMDVDSFVDMVGRAKIVVNTALTLTGGIHERIATALLGKAVCFSPDCYYLQENFSESVRRIDLRHLDRMVDDMREVIEHFEEYHTWLDQRYKWAKENHTWRKRGQQLLEMIDL